MKVWAVIKWDPLTHSSAFCHLAGSVSLALFLQSVSLSFLEQLSHSFPAGLQGVYTQTPFQEELASPRKWVSRLIPTVSSFFRIHFSSRLPPHRPEVTPFPGWPASSDWVRWKYTGRAMSASCETRRALLTPELPAWLAEGLLGLRHRWGSSDPYCFLLLYFTGIDLLWTPFKKMFKKTLYWDIIHIPYHSPRSKCSAQWFLVYLPSCATITPI